MLQPRDQTRGVPPNQFEINCRPEGPKVHAPTRNPTYSPAFSSVLIATFQNEAVSSAIIGFSSCRNQRRLEMLGARWQVVQVSSPCLPASTSAPLAAGSAPAGPPP